jgi:hypothetical protein
VTEDITRTFTRLLIYDAEFEPDEVVSVFSEIGTETWLAKNPFEKIVFSGKVFYENREVHGLYSAFAQEVHVATTRSSDIQPFRWGEIQAVSHTALTSLEAIRKTLIHELGHHLHAHLLQLNKTQFMQTTLMVRTNAISHYGRVNF